MKKMLFVLLGVIMALTMVALPAQATPPENAQGLWYYMPSILDVKVVGGNTFLTITDVGNWNGTFDGDSTECDVFPVCAVSEDAGTVVAYASGHAFYAGVNTFPSVTVNGKAGRLVMRVNGVKFGDSWDGRWVIIEGEGELAGLQGQGTWWGPGYNPAEPLEYGEIHYAGDIHFEGD